MFWEKNYSDCEHSMFVRQTLIGFILCVLLSGCSRSDDAKLAIAKAETEDVRAELAATQKELAEAKAELRNAHSIEPKSKPASGNQASSSTVLKTSLDEKDMTTPIKAFRDYPIQDFRTLPNCLEVISECFAVPYEKQTDEQYKNALLNVAKKPCRMLLKVVNISAGYDFGEFEILTDDGKSGLKVLSRNDGYESYLRNEFAINDIKSKGLSAKHAIGDRIVLVGLGDIVGASLWGASSPSKGVPRGDSRHVTLRAFGMRNKYRPNDYEFAFMIRNWYIAQQ